MRPLLKTNKKFFNKYSGQRCFVICTGASIKELDLANLPSKGRVFGCNFLFKHHQFRPDQFTAYFDLDTERGMRHNPDPMLLPDHYFSQLDTVFRTSRTTLFFSAENHKFFRKNSLHQSERVHYIKAYKKLEHVRELSVDLAGKFTCSDGVVYAMIGSAIYMGFKEIYLAGCGYTYSPMQHGHFYENWVKTDSGTIDNRHRKLKAFAETRGIRIINITPHGFSSPVYESIRPEEISKLPDL
jgi:hypothetical protein